jgi:hypothetical protein
MNARPSFPYWNNKWLWVGLGVLAIVTLGAIGVLTFLDSGYFRKTLIEYVAARTGRRVEVDGPLTVHFLSSSPSLTAERVTLGNPPWMPPGVMAQVGKLTLQFDFPLPGRTSSVQKLEMTSATLHLVRDAAGRGNWQWSPPGTPRRGEGRLIRSLSMPNARVELDDARRHLQFSGTISAQDVNGAAGDAPPLRIEGNGQLNGRPVQFTINADPLATATHDRPYGFSFVERSGDTQLTGSGHLLQPFDPGVLDTTFDASGASLRELYFLVGISLPETAPFTLTGTLARRGPRSEFRQLLARFGKSDVQGNVLTHVVDGHPRFDADVHSGLLRFADLGRHGADGSPVRVVPSKFVVPDAQLPLQGLRNRNWVVRYQADSIEMRGQSLHAFATDATGDQGVLAAPAFTATFNEAQLTGSVKIDAKDDSPKTDLDLKIKGLELSHFLQKGLIKPPFGGALQARIQVTGRGNSLHEFASSANGMVTAVLPHGSMRASLAELTGINLRGIGLKFSKSEEEASVRCAIASFQAKDGTLSANRLIVDTEPVVITGNGAIHLDSETLDLTLHGQPRDAQLVRMRSPIYVRGSLRHPEFGVNRAQLVAQAGEAVALGVVLTPIAAIIAFADPGLAKDGQCSEELVATSMPRFRKTAKGVTESANGESRRREEN